MPTARVENHRVRAGLRSSAQHPRILYFSEWKAPRLYRSATCFLGKGTKGLSTILLVEDIMANRALAVKLLKAAGHEVIEAADGEAAIVAAQSKRPDLVLMDLSLPGMDGWEA